MCPNASAPLLDDWSGPAPMLEDVQLRAPQTAAAYDVFGTANFFVFKPFAAAFEHILEIGVDRIRAHDQMLVDRFISALDGCRFSITSPLERGSSRSTLVFFSHRDPARNAELHQALAQQRVWIAVRAGQLRLSAHLYNSAEEIDRAAALLNDLG